MQDDMDNQSRNSRNKSRKKTSAGAKVQTTVMYEASS